MILVLIWHTCIISYSNAGHKRHACGSELACGSRGDTLAAANLLAVAGLNVLMGQCLNRRIDNIEKMQKEVLAWQTHRNNKEATINWQFTNEDARIKLKRLYPTILD